MNRWSTPIKTLSTQQNQATFVSDGAQWHHVCTMGTDSNDGPPNYYGRLREKINQKVYAGDWCLEINREMDTVDLVTPLLRGGNPEYTTLLRDPVDDFPSPTMVATLVLMFG